MLLLLLFFNDVSQILCSHIVIFSRFSTGTGSRSAELPDPRWLFGADAGNAVGQ